MNLLYIFIGGGIGSLARYMLGRYITSYYPGPFPYATLTINILASFLLGLLLGWLTTRYPTQISLHLLVAVGFCGGFSTFSTFSLETVHLLKSGNLVSAFAYIGASVLLCLSATFVGLLFTRS